MSLPRHKAKQHRLFVIVIISVITFQWDHKIKQVEYGQAFSLAGKKHTEQQKYSLLFIASL